MLYVLVIRGYFLELMFRLFAPPAGDPAPPPAKRFDTAKRVSSGVTGLAV